MPIDTNQRLSDHFSLAEFLKSDTATRRGIRNICNEGQLAELQALCRNVLEPIRQHFGRPMRTTSGFRSVPLCLAVGSSDKSQHARGQAWDGEIPGVSNLEVARWVADSDLPFDQLILEGYDGSNPNSGWIHISHKSNGQNRRMFGTWNKRRGYRWGSL